MLAFVVRLAPRSPDDAAHLVAAFRRGLSEGGFVEGLDHPTIPQRLWDRQAKIAMMLRMSYLHFEFFRI